MCVCFFLVRGIGNATEKCGLSLLVWTTLCEMHCRDSLEESETGLCMSVSTAVTLLMRACSFVSSFVFMAEMVTRMRERYSC